MLSIVSPSSEFGSWFVHVSPSGEVRITPLPMCPLTGAVPMPPTATNWPPPQVTALSEPVVFDACGVHAMPSGDVKIAPLPQTATNRLSPHVIAVGKSGIAPACTVQCRPSTDVISEPPSPIAAKTLPFHAMPLIDSPVKL